MARKRNGRNYPTKAKKPIQPTRFYAEEKENTNAPELALLALMDLAWLTRLGFVVFFAYRFLKGELLIAAAMPWKIVFFLFYFIFGTISTIYTFLFWKKKGALNKRKDRIYGMGIRLLFHSVTIGLIALEMAWDFGHKDWVVSILTSVLGGGLWFAVITLLTSLALKWSKEAKDI